MKLAGVLLVVAAIALGACAHSRPVASLAEHAKPGPTLVSSMDSRRDIVLAVANPFTPPGMHAGSSSLGYIPSGHYGAGQRAAATLAALKQSYGWREVTGWPIKALDLYCVVLEPPAGVARDTLLKTLANDDRVQLAQPLQEYSVYSEEPRSHIVTTILMSISSAALSKPMPPSHIT